MEDNSSNQFQPLTMQPTATPVLHIDLACESGDLHDEGMFRLIAAKQMLETIGCLPVHRDGTTHPHDAGNIAQAAQILLSDATDLIEAAHDCAQREIEQGSDTVTPARLVQAHG